MLIQHLICTDCAFFFQFPFDPSAAEPGAIGVGRFGRVFAFNTFFKSVQIDQVTHDTPIIQKFDEARV